MQRQVLARTAVVAAVAIVLYVALSMASPTDTRVQAALAAALMGTVFFFLPRWLLRPYAVRRHRERNGLCVQCGYDLRASPGRCPECGAEVR